MTLWGSKARLETCDKGNFSCPHCERTRAYRHYRVLSYFTLLAVPLVENGILGDYIECSVCKRQFAPANVTVIGEMLPQQGIKESPRFDKPATSRFSARSAPSAGLRSFPS